MQENQTQKPITLLREDFIENIQNLCNSSGLPFFVISDVLKWLIPQVDEVSKRETERDRTLLKAEEAKVMELEKQKIDDEKK